MEQAGIALRGLFIINPHGVVQQVTINNLPIGRSVDETLRLLQVGLGCVQVLLLLLLHRRAWLGCCGWQALGHQWCTTAAVEHAS